MTQASTKKLENLLVSVVPQIFTFTTSSKSMNFQKKNGKKIGIILISVFNTSIFHLQKFQDGFGKHFSKLLHQQGISVVTEKPGAFID